MQENELEKQSDEKTETEISDQEVSLNDTKTEITAEDINLEAEESNSSVSVKLGTSSK